MGAEQEHDLGGNEWSTSDCYFTHIEMVLPLTLRPLLCCCCCCCRHPRRRHHPCHPRPCRPRLPLHCLHLFSEYVR
jgi:hypothetical protein